MIADRATEIEVQSTVQGESVGMTFDENSLVHLMSVLTDLYSDPEMAVIREYATNALDAHIEAGQSRPIEVWLPSDLSPFYKTKDYGVGLDFEDIVQIYSKYGASTKRDTNDQVGMLGLGCKSALTYTSQFSLVGVKDNIRTTVSVSRDEEGAGSMTLIEQVHTVEPNGVEVIVPVKRYHSFKEKAAQFFSYWTPGTVLVNGVQPEHIDGVKIGEDILIEPTGRRGREDKIVMGGVAYPATFSNIKLRYGSGSVIAYVNVGDIHFTPSREALSMTNKTKATIEAIEKRFADGIRGVIEESVQNAKDRFEALRVAIEWRAMLGDDVARVRYRGSKIPASLDAPKGQYLRVVAVESRHLGDSSRDQSVPASLAVNALWVHDFWATKFTANQKKRLMKYAEQHGLKGEVTHFVLTNKPIKHLWIPDDRRASWEEVRKITLPRTGSAAYHNQVAGTYEVWTQGHSYLVTTDADEIDTKEPIFYFIPNMGDFYSDWEADKARTLVFKYHPTATIAKTPANRVNKFKRLFPTAVRLRDFIQELQQKAVAQIPRSHRIHMVHKDEMRCLVKLNPKRVKDPALRKAIRIAQEDVSVSQSLLSELRDLRMGVDLTSDLDWQSPLDKYPLFDANPYVRIDDIEDHLYTYFNAIYALTEEGN